MGTRRSILGLCFLVFSMSYADQAVQKGQFDGLWKFNQFQCYNKKQALNQNNPRKAETPFAIKGVFEPDIDLNITTSINPDTNTPEHYAEKSILQSTCKFNQISLQEGNECYGYSQL